MNSIRSISRATISSVKRSCSFSTMAEKLDPVQEASLGEMCILVDENDTAIGSASKRDCHRVRKGGEIPLHRAFSVFLFNTADELLLQKRSSSKITFPGYFTNTCCSHPLYEIESERNEVGALGIKLAAQRRLNHELGIPYQQVDPSELRYLTRIMYKSLGDGVWGEHEVDYILFLRKDVTLDPNPEEISDLCYVPKNKMEDFLKGIEAPITPWFSLIAKNRLGQWWENLDVLEKFEDHETIHTFT